VQRDTSGIDLRDLTARLAAAYDLALTGLSFLPLGEDGYSYRAESVSGTPYFVKARPARRQQAAILALAFQATVWLHDVYGQSAVLAPHTTSARAPYMRYNSFIVALFPYIDGTSAMDAALSDAAWQRLAGLVADVHEGARALPTSLRVRKDVCTISYRPTLVRLLRRGIHAQVVETPLGQHAALLLREQHDDLVATLHMLEQMHDAAQRDSRPLVLTHGDPNPTNIMTDAQGQLYLLDWDGLALGLPERDLTFFTGPRFEVFLRAYAAKSRLRLLDADVFRFYFYHWALQEISDYGTRLVAGQAHDDELRHAWDELQQYLPLQHAAIARGTQAVQDALHRVALVVRQALFDTWPEASA